MQRNATNAIQLFINREKIPVSNIFTPTPPLPLLIHSTLLNHSGFFPIHSTHPPPPPLLFTPTPLLIHSTLPCYTTNVDRHEFKISAVQCRGPVQDQCGGIRQNTAGINHSVWQLFGHFLCNICHKLCKV